MKAHPSDIRQEALKLLRQKISPREIADRLSITLGAVEDWAAEWRKDGSLKIYKRAGQEFTKKAQEISNGYYKSIRKRYHGMRRLDRLEKREFGFNSPVEAVPYYLDQKGIPRVCAYCGRVPEQGKVWGLDRLDSSRGHVPGNLVPCCGFHQEGSQLSCQASKSKYSLFGWMEMALSRSLGHPVCKELVEGRIKKIYSFANELVSLTY